MNIKNWRTYLDIFCDRCVYGFGQYIGALFPIKNNKVFVSSYAGMGFGCNAKAVVLKLHEKNPELDIVWQLKDLNDEMPSWIRKVKIGSFLSYFEMATAKVWIDNKRKPLHIRKRDGQFYIQTWHGYNGPKKAEGDTPWALSKGYLALAKHDSSMIDLFVSNGTHFTNTIRRAFWYDGEIIEEGAPRCDILHDKNYKSRKVRDFFNIPQDSAIVLYAPTFRNSKRNVYDIDFSRLRETLIKKYNKDVRVLLRLHPNMRTMNLGFVYNEWLLNASLYPDMYELMAEASFFITDYSSSLFEFASTLKPTFIYASDVADYTNERGFHFDLMKLPISLSQNNIELVDNIMSFDEREFESEMKLFLEHVGIKETGHASEFIADRIIQECNYKRLHNDRKHQ